MQVLKESGGAWKIPGVADFAMDGVGLYSLAKGEKGGSWVRASGGVGCLVHDHRITGGLVLIQGQGLVEGAHDGAGNGVNNRAR